MEESRCCEVAAVGFFLFVVLVFKEYFQNKKARTHRFSPTKKVSFSFEFSFECFEECILKVLKNREN